MGRVSDLFLKNTQKIYTSVFFLKSESVISGLTSLEETGSVPSGGLGEICFQ